jgi:PBS lyase HEAT-like repeat-containing protein
MTLIQELTSLLESSASQKRRSAAKKLRKLGDPLAGPALLSALKRELPDKRTWETQYQMIMALGHCGYKESTPLLHILAYERFEHTMVLVAVGDAYVRLSRTSDDDSKPLFDVIAVCNDHMLLDGALRAVAMLRMNFGEDCTAKIIDAVVARNEEYLWFWTAAACPGWSGAAVEAFLDRCLLSNREDIQTAARAAKLKKYRKWNPL